MTIAPGRRNRGLRVRHSLFGPWLGLLGLALGACAAPATGSPSPDGSLPEDLPTLPEDLPTLPEDLPGVTDLPGTQVDRASFIDVAPTDDAPPVVDRPAAPRDQPPPPPDLPPAPVDVVLPRDVSPPPPPPVCRAGGGSTTVMAPRRIAGFRDQGQEAWLGSVAVADLDRDGTREVIATRGLRVVVWGRDGVVRWGRAPGTGRVWAAALVGDFVGDAALEVVAAAGPRIALFDARGNVSAGFPANGRDEVRALAGGDLDGDARPEIVAATTTTSGRGAREDVLIALRGNGSVLAGYPPNGTGTSRCDEACDIAGAFDQNLAVGRLDGDATDDVLCPTDNAYASWHRGNGEAFPVSSIFRGVTRSPGVRFFLGYAESQQGYANNEATSNQAHFTNTAPALADLDGDGSRELVMLSSVQNASQSDRRRGVALWVLRPDGTRPAAWTNPLHLPAYLGGLVDLGGNLVAATQQVAVADLDARAPGLEMVFAGFDGQVHAVGADRSRRWSHAFSTSPTVLTGGVIVVDLSDDGRPEVVFATYGPQANAGALHVLDANGTLLHRIALPGRGAMAVPTAADLEGDGTLELLVSLKDPAPDGAEVLAFTVPGSGTRCMPWPTGRANLLRNGSL